MSSLLENKSSSVSNSSNSQWCSVSNQMSVMDCWFKHPLTKTHPICHTTHVPLFIHREVLKPRYQLQVVIFNRLIHSRKDSFNTAMVLQGAKKCAVNGPNGFPTDWRGANLCITFLYEGAKSRRDKVEHNMVAVDVNLTNIINCCLINRNLTQYLMSLSLSL